MNYRMIIHILGYVLILESACMLLPLACAVIYGEYVAWTFLGCIALCLACGTLLRCLKVKKHSMYAKEGLVIVSMSWILISIFGALPFKLSGAIPNLVDALFETVSGFTTTGSSILTDIEALPKSLLFWRSFTHWIGGMGVLVFLMSLVRLSGGNNIYLLKAESTGPSVGKIVPKIQSSTKILYGMYSILTVAEMILLIAGGMKFYDAITISFGTAGTGGFAILNSSLATYTSYQQNVVTIFMLLFGIDFSLYYLLLIGKVKEVFRSEELRGYIGIVFLSIILIWLNISGLYDSIWTALKHSAFQVATIITTTGYATDNFNVWPELSKAILVILMFIGACAGSTGGGIKVCRIMILFKSIIKELMVTVHPKITKKITMNGRIVEHETVRTVNVFFAAYLIIFVFALLIISLDNFDFTTNFTAVAATLNNIGPGLNVVGPIGNFSGYSNLSKIVLSFCMLIGRLEVFPMLILFSPYTWKK